MNTQNTINFKSRNKEIRMADDLSRRINNIYPRISSSKLESSPNIDNFQNVIATSDAIVRQVREVIDVKINPETSFLKTTEIILNTIKKLQHGNCYESALLAQIFAKLNGLKNVDIMSLYCNKNNMNYDLDHAVLLVKDKKPYLIDCWLGFADYVPKAFERYNKEFRNFFDFKTNNYVKKMLLHKRIYKMLNLDKTVTDEELQFLKKKYNK